MKTPQLKLRKIPARTRLRSILAYEFSGERSFESCDIPTRERIERLIPRLMKACGIN